MWYSLRLGVVGTAVIREHEFVADALGIELRQRPQLETDGRGSLLIRKLLDVGKTSGIVDRDMGFLIAGTMAGSQTPITSDPLLDALKTSKLFGVDMAHVACLGPLIVVNPLDILQIVAPVQAQCLEQCARNGVRCRNNTSDATDGEAPKAEPNNVMQLL